MTSSLSLFTSVAPPRGRESTSVSSSSHRTRQCRLQLWMMKICEGNELWINYFLYFWSVISLSRDTIDVWWTTRFRSIMQLWLACQPSYVRDFAKECTIYRHDSISATSAVCYSFVLALSHSIIVGLSARQHVTVVACCEANQIWTSLYFARLHELVGFLVCLFSCCMVYFVYDLIIIINYNNWKHTEKGRRGGEGECCFQSSWGIV